jgi:peptidoglycan/xylan/chitin deacetylase (PgdA/CDA1 family)
MEESQIRNHSIDRHYSFGMSRLVAILSILVRPYLVLRVPGIPQTLGRMVVVSVLLLGAPLKSFLAHNFGLDPAVGVEGTVSLTFDDGFQSAFDASRILDQAGLHGTYYIITRVLGRPGYMTVDEVKELCARGHQIGSHTRTHPHLPTLTLVQQNDEIAGSRRDLKAWGIDATAFAFPYGEHDSNSMIALQEAGFETARTTDQRLSGTDPYLLPGFPVTNTTTVASVIATIDYAHRNGTHLILEWHRFDEQAENEINWRSDQLKAVVDYLVKNHVRVVAVVKQEIRREALLPAGLVGLFQTTRFVPRLESSTMWFERCPKNIKEDT